MNFFNLGIYCVFLVFICALLLVNHVEIVSCGKIVRLPGSPTQDKMTPQNFIEWSEPCLRITESEHENEVTCRNGLMATFGPKCFVKLIITPESAVAIKSLLAHMVSLHTLRIDNLVTIKDTIQYVPMTSINEAHTLLRQLFDCLMACMEEPFTGETYLNSWNLYPLADAFAIVLRMDKMIMNNIDINIDGILKRYGDCKKFEFIPVEIHDFSLTSELTDALIGNIEGSKDIGRAHIGYAAVKYLMRILTVILQTRHNQSQVEYFLRYVNTESPEPLIRADAMIRTLLLLERLLRDYWSHGDIVRNLTNQIYSTINAYVEKDKALDKLELHNLIEHCRSNVILKKFNEFSRVSFKTCKDLVKGVEANHAGFFLHG